MQNTHRQTIESQHLPIIAPDVSGDGLTIECGWCDTEIGSTHQSSNLPEITAMAKAHWDEIEAQ